MNNLADNLTLDEPVVSVDVTEHEARVLAAHQRESALKGIHEAGHAVLATLLGIRVKTADISIRHSGETTLGFLDETEAAFVTASRMSDLVVVSLAGMEAERRFLGELTDGSSGDLLDATNRCLDIVGAGMEPDVPTMSFRAFGGFQQLPHPHWMADRIAKAVDERMSAAQQRAADLVESHAEQILSFARVLFTAPYRRLSDDKLDEALRAVGLEPPAPYQPVGGTRRRRRRRRG